MKKVDLFVIGGGSGGVRAARVAAGYGAKVMLAEEHRIGGTCVIRGCVPKKLLVYAARFAEEFEAAEGYGWTLGQRSFDWPTLVPAGPRIAWLEQAYADTLSGPKSNIKSRASFQDSHTIRPKVWRAYCRRMFSSQRKLAASGDPFPHQHAMSERGLPRFASALDRGAGQRIHCS